MTFLENIEIKNFKSIRHQRIDRCKRINVFIGYPNVGKSNILESIGLLTFIRKQRPVGLNGLVRLERLAQLFNYTNIHSPSEISINDEYKLSVNYENESYVVFELLTKQGKYPNGQKIFELSVGLNSVKPDSSIDEVSGTLNRLSNFNVKQYKFSISRGFNKPFSALDLKVPYGENMFEVIINNKDLLKEFSNLLRPYKQELVVDSSENEIKITPFADKGIIHTIPISLVADSLVRLMFFKTAISTNAKSILIFEEPEAHIFPPYIRKFTGDIILDRSNQYFIATHSPYVIDSFMGDAENELAIFLVYFEDGETKVKSLSHDDINEVRKYGIDLFYNLESYLKNG